MCSVRSCVESWKLDGTVIAINDLLRNLARHALSHDPEPSISIHGSLSVNTTDGSGPRGDDEKSSADANASAGVICMGTWCVCLCIQPIAQLPKRQDGWWRRIITSFLEYTRFGRTSGINTVSRHGCTSRDDTLAHHCTTTTTIGGYRHSQAMDRRTLDGVGRTPSIGEERIQP